MTVSSRRRAQICWGIVAAAWLVQEAAVAMPRKSSSPSPPTAVPPAWMVAVACVGAALFVAATAWRRGRACMRIHRRLSRPSSIGVLHLEGFALKAALAAAILAVLVFVPWNMDRESILLALGDVGPYLCYLIPFGYVFLRARAIRTPLSEWGWRRGRGVLRELSIGLLAGPALFLSRHVLRMPSGAGNVGALFAISRTTLALDVMIWTPIVEETLYRGALYRYLRDRFRWLPAAVLSAAIFGAMHSPESTALAYVLGLLCAMLREWRGSLIAPMAAHASWNALAIAAAGSWS